MYKETEIVQWATDRGIISAGDRLTQGLKTLSEITEASDNILENKDILDDLGDIYVTIAVQAALNDKTLEECMEVNIPVRESAKEQIADMVYDCGMMLQSIMDNDSFVTTYISNIYMGLQQLASINNLDLKNCIDHSYKIITARTGKMVDGVFVKDVKI